MSVYAVDIGQEFALGNKGIENVFPRFGNLFSTILFNVYGLTGIIFLFLLIFGGFSIIIGAGSGKSGQVEKGSKALTAAIIGFIVIFASFFIIQLIETITGVNILNSNL